MSRIALFGATGSLGSHVARQALAAGHQVSVFVRAPSRLAEDIRARATIVSGDIMAAPVANIAAFMLDHDAVVNCAGLVTEGARFVELFDRVVTAVEFLVPERRPPVCWFLAGAGLLDLDPSGRCGIDLPKVGGTYWPHRANFRRLQRSDIGWRLLCPGPMVQGEPIGVDDLRMSIDTLPAPLPSWTRRLPGPLLLPFFAGRIPQMIIPYADAAAYMLSNIAPGGALTHKRAGLALPVGMKGHKDTWAAQPRGAS